MPYIKSTSKMIYHVEHIGEAHRAAMRRPERRCRLRPEQSNCSLHKNMNYREFLQTKVELAKDSGFDVDKGKINAALKPHQRDAVIWALKGGAKSTI